MRTVRFRLAMRPVGRLAHIDGLRAVAVLMVMCFHARVHTPHVPLDHFFKEGTHGVDLFFVLSGFCLAMPTLERIRRAGTTRFDVAGFTAKRLLRIVPPYAVAVLIFAGAGSFALARGWTLPAGMPAAFDWSDVLGELFFLDRNLQHINSSFWSLAVEFRWYFLFVPALALWVARPRALLTVIALLVIAGEMTRATSTDVGVLPAFLLGIVAAHVFVYEHPLARFAFPLALAGCGLGLLLERSYHFPIQTNFGWHVAAFAFVVLAGRPGWLQRLLSNRTLVAFGTASYSIYLVHEPIESLTVATFAATLGIWPAFVVALVLGASAGCALWYVVERPLVDRAFVLAFVGHVRDPIARLFGAVDVPDEIQLRRETAPAAQEPFVPVLVFSRPAAPQRLP